MTQFALTFKAQQTISMVLEDFVLLLLFYHPPPSTLHLYFCQSIFIFTRPNDGSLHKSMSPTVTSWWCYSLAIDWGETPLYSQQPLGLVDDRDLFLDRDVLPSLLGNLLHRSRVTVPNDLLPLPLLLLPNLESSTESLIKGQWNSFAQIQHEWKTT